MNEPPGDPGGSSSPIASDSRPRARWARVVGFVLGLLLLAAAAYVLIGRRDELSSAWRAARSAPLRVVLATLLLPLGNWAFTSAIFWSLTRRYARVGVWEMSALMGSAWLLNMLPFKPGLFGRIAYHRRISNIPIVTSVLVTITAALTGAIGIAIAISLQLACDPALRADAPPAIFAGVIGGAFAMALALAGLLGWRTRAAGLPMFSGPWPVLGAIVLRVADTHLWALRYLLAFGLIGHAQPYGLCLVVAGVSQIASQLPVQFGLREWSVGGSSAVLSAGPGRVALAAAVPGLTTDILCRAAEICCALPVGLVSTLWIYGRVARSQSSEYKRPMRGNSHPTSGV